jgi:hypothetical protein
LSQIGWRTSTGLRCTPGTHTLSFRGCIQRTGRGPWRRRPGAFPDDNTCRTNAGRVAAPGWRRHAPRGAKQQLYQLYCPKKRSLKETHAVAAREAAAQFGEQIMPAPRPPWSRPVSPSFALSVSVTINVPAAVLAPCGRNLRPASWCYAAAGTASVLTHLVATRRAVFGKQLHSGKLLFALRCACARRTHGVASDLCPDWLRGCGRPTQQVLLVERSRSAT